MTATEPLWAQEVEQKGLETALVERLRQHGGLTMRDAVANTGKPLLTIQRALEKLVSQGKAVKSNGHYRV